MSGRSATLSRAVILLLCAAPAVAGPDIIGFAPEVYRDRNVLVHAGLDTQDSQSVHLGDVLSLAITVSWKGENATLDEPDEQFLSDMLSGDFDPMLLDTVKMEGSGTGLYDRELRYRFLFQITGCPDDNPTCPGDRSYGMPEFTLSYHGKSNTEPTVVKFRPEPQTLSIRTTITHDGADQLYPLVSYFPSAAYPDPTPVIDGTKASLAVFAIGSAILLGGVVMWPFRLRRKQAFATREVFRWETLLLEVQRDEGRDERRLADRMRRCLTWYCHDQLGVDPFTWLPAGDTRPTEESHVELRDLFLDLLHDPTGKGAGMRDRLTEVVRARS